MIFMATDFALAAGEGKDLLASAKSLFAKKKWTRAMDKLNLAGEFLVDPALRREAALYTGAIYAEMGKDKLAAENLSIYLASSPEAAVPPTFTERMSVALEKVRRNFPVVSNIGFDKERFEPYRNTLKVTFRVSADPAVLAKSNLIFVILSTTGALKREIVIKDATPGKKLGVEWDGKDMYNVFINPGNYRFGVRAELKKGTWEHTYTRPVTLGGNIDSSEIRQMMKRARRITRISGKRNIDYIPGKPFRKIGTEPTFGTSKGFWNTVYYIFIGSVRDVLDFPIKYLCSQPVVGHALTFPIVIGGSAGYASSAWTIDYEDYYFNVTGEYDDATYNSDKKIVANNKMMTTIGGVVWVGAYAGVMSVLSWAGTDDGIVKGFNSYFESNAYWNGYDKKYFFPNYRSLTFSDTRVDKPALAMLKEKISAANGRIQREISDINKASARFNTEKVDPFKKALADRQNEALYDSAFITVKPK